MTIRRSNGAAFTVLEAEPALRTGIQVHIYAGDDPANLLAVLDRTYNRKWLDELNGVGTGSFAVDARHPKIVADPTILEYGNLVRMVLDGIDRFAFVIEKKRRRPAGPGEDADNVIDVAGRGVLSLLEGALLYPEGGLGGSADRVFVDATAGDILNETFVNEAQTRGALDGVSTDFDATLDSDGEPWPTNLSISEKAGRDGLRLVDRLTDLAIDVNMSPALTLSAYVERGVDRSIQTPDTGPVVLRPAHNILEANVEGTGIIRNALLIEGPSGFTEQSDGTSIGTYNRREAFLALGNATSFAQINASAEAAFDRNANPLEAITLKVDDVSGHRPYVDFRPGDWVLAPDGDSNLTRYRCRGIAVEEDAQGRPVFVPILNHILLELEERTQRWIKTMSPGTLGGTEAGIADPSKTTGDAEAAGEGAVGDHEASFLHPDELGDLVDVDLTGLNDGDQLTYDQYEDLWVPAGPGGAADSSVIEGTYTGTGVAFGTVVTLAEECALVFVSGTPSGGTPVQGWAIAGAPDGLRIDNAPAIDEQLRLLSDGVTVQADGTGGAGLNESGATYYYVGIKR